MVALTQLDRSGRINIDNLLDAAANSIDPVLADRVLQPTEAAQEQVVRQVTDDLAKIFAGIEMPARPNGAQIALTVIQQYASQPDVAESEHIKMKLCCEHVLRSTLDSIPSKCNKQQNAQIGRVGTEPAQMGRYSTHKEL